MRAEFVGAQMLRSGEVRQVRELRYGIKAEVCVGASAVYGSAVFTIVSRSPRVMKAMAELKRALVADAEDLMGRIQTDRIEDGRGDGAQI